MGGFVMLIPAAFISLARGDPRLALNQLRLTHNSPRLENNGALFVDLLSGLVKGEKMGDMISNIGTRLGIDFNALVKRNQHDIDVVANTFGLSCYIHMSFPSLLYL